MDLIRLRIPHSFIRGRIPMTWRDVLFGLEQELLDPSAPADFAWEQLTGQQDFEPELVDLARLEKWAPSRWLVETLARREQGQAPEETQRKWLYLVLAWFFEHRDEIADPLGRVELVYADFGYPAEIESFVGYMPSDAPNLGPEQNKARLFAKWNVHLEECRAAFALKAKGEE